MAWDGPLQNNGPARPYLSNPLEKEWPIMGVRAGAGSLKFYGLEDMLASE